MKIYLMLVGLICILTACVTSPWGDGRGRNWKKVEKALRYAGNTFQDPALLNRHPSDADTLRAIGEGFGAAADSVDVWVSEPDGELSLQDVLDTINVAMTAMQVYADETENETIQDVIFYAKTTLNGVLISLPEDGDAEAQPE